MPQNKTSLSIDPNRAAVLIMDYQSDVIAKFSSDSGLLPRAARVLDRARAAHIPLIHVVIWFRTGYPELPKVTMFSDLRSSGRQQEGKTGTGIHPAVAPRPGEVTVVRRRVGAFSTSDLRQVLSGYGRDHLVLFGITTSGVVLSTVRAGADLDYQMTVIGDCCSDGDAEVHRVLTEKVFPVMAPVVSAEDFIAALPAGRA
jgi:nicotinamidase-related amidase